MRLGAAEYKPTAYYDFDCQAFCDEQSHILGGPNISEALIDSLIGDD